MALVAVGVCLGLLLVALAAAASRDRRLYLIGGSEEVNAHIEGLARFRLEAPFSARLYAAPGRYAITPRRGPARDALEVTYAPWTSQVAAPVQRGQCLIVASGAGFYEGGQPDRLVIHEVTRETREVALPFATDHVAAHPCRLPSAIPLLDTIVVILSVRCAEAPDTDAEARRRMLDALMSCGAAEPAP